MATLVAATYNSARVKLVPVNKWFRLLSGFRAATVTYKGTTGVRVPAA